VALTSQPSLRIATVAGMQAALSVLLAVLLVHVSLAAPGGLCRAGCLVGAVRRFNAAAAHAHRHLCAGLMALGVLILAGHAGRGRTDHDAGVMALVAGAATHGRQPLGAGRAGGRIIALPPVRRWCLRLMD
jgi:hypothetical protein